HKRQAFVAPDSKIHGIVAKCADNTWETIRIDVAFPVLHGLYGEDGTVQGLFKLACIPFVGCGVSASAVCMDKAIAKALCDAYQIPQSKWDSALVSDLRDEDGSFFAHLEEHLGYPIFVKPANAGSSVGITKVKNREELKQAVKTAAEHDNKLVFEENLVGHEVECAVLGNENPVASCCGEIRPCNEFYDYNAKYLANRTELDIPAKLPKEESEKVRREAVRAFKLLGCKGMTRMDFFVCENGDVLLNEPNTIPGFTAISMYPKLFEAVGTSYSDLLEKLLQLAMGE
ncbi:MAG TPA: D-alanine--D-alanine ligase A, partial [Ruminococcaceae bacterium]|nr:D-alanine--D-alanine ligase A [Oscillospiraceae bacterium]